MGKCIDMTGVTTENGIYVIEKAKKQDKETCWRCKCPICGRENWIVRGSRLRGDKQIKMCKNCSSLNNLSKIKTPYFKDITNCKFGKLTALEKTNIKNHNTYLWKCQCECGNVCLVDGEYLRNGDTQSCGCDLSSKGEKKIESILKANNINYEKEKTFNNFIYSETGRYPRFDFYIIDKNYLIEYDGKQHFKATLFSENLKLIQERDMIKNNWCQQQHIQLIRIPYTKYDTLCLEDLLLETSNFIYNRKEKNSNNGK